MKLLYICFQDFSNISAANIVRPYQLYKAFLNLSLEVTLIATSQDRKNKKNREKLIYDCIHSLKTKKPDLCYIESPTAGIKFTCDYKLIQSLHKHKVPTAFFYRDFYHKFQGVGYQYNGSFALLSDLYNRYRQYCTDKIANLFDIVYFPSQGSFDAFSFTNMRVLPPAGVKALKKQSTLNNTCIYVGGLSERYGTDLLIDAFHILNKDAQYPLLLVCREDDLQLYPQLKNEKWIEIIHSSGKDLEKYYEKASLALIPLKHTPYNNIAVSVKLFEYLSFGKPILCTHNQAMVEILKRNQCGVTCEDSPESLAKAIKNTLNNPELLKNLSENAYHAVQETENWDARATQIIKDLLGKK